MTWPSLSPGDQPDPIFSAARHNAVNELLALHGLDGNPGSRAEGPNCQNTFLRIKNTTSTDVPLGGVLGFEESIFDADDNASAFRTDELSFNGVEPTQDSHGNSIGVAVDLCPVGKIRRFAVSGWVRARVDISDTDHNFAKIVDNDVTKLESADSGIPMIPAQSGTGEKWAIVQLGGSAQQTHIILGRATTAVTSGTPTFSIDNIVVVQGTDPRPSPVNANQAITVKNTFSLDISETGKVRAEKNKAGDWEAMRPGEGGDPPVIARFRLTADMGLADTSAAAILLNDDGTATADTITVTDSKGAFTGRGPYVDAAGNNQLGFEGVAIKYTIAGPADRYYIIDLERFYPSILVEIESTITTGAGGVDSIYQKGYGNSYRIPEGSASAKVTVYNTDHFADGAANGTDWVAYYDPANDRYELIKGISDIGDYHVVKGMATSTVSDATASFDIDNLELVRGKLPSGSTITVTNDPPCVFANDDVVYAAYNELVGSDSSDHWDTGDAHNWLAQFKGHGGWDATKDQSPGHDAAGAPEWQEDKDCDT